MYTIHQDETSITVETDTGAYARYIVGIGVEDGIGDIHPVGDGSREWAYEVAYVLAAQDDGVFFGELVSTLLSRVTRNG